MLWKKLSCSHTKNQSGFTIVRKLTNYQRKHKLQSGFWGSIQLFHELRQHNNRYLYMYIVQFEEYVDFLTFHSFFIFALYDLIHGSSLRQSDPVCVWWRQLRWRQRIDSYSWSQRTARELGCHPYIRNW